MKQVILDVLEDCSVGQINLSSKAARETIANLIMVSIKSNGWYLDLGTHKSNELDTAGHPVKKINEWLTQDIDEAVMIDNCSHGNDLNSICHECDEQQARDTWICSICGKSTYAVDYDYLGSGTNHLECELKIDLKDRSREEKISEETVNVDYIYESPDGGETVYRRKFGEDERELYKVKDD